MVTVSDDLALSGAVYGGPENTNAPPGWTIIKESAATPGNQGSPNGYFGAAFKNNTTGEIVIANRGSRASVEGLEQDWGTSDVQILAQGSKGIPGAFADATKFAESVHAENPGQPISFTGHSLGGAMAQLQAAATGGGAVTFGAPGVAFAVDKNAARAVFGKVVNYVLPGDLIGSSGTHVGKVVLVTPSGITLIKDLAAIGAAIAIGGPLGALIAALGLVVANHPLDNYAKAINETSSQSASGGAGRPAARLTDMHSCPMVTGVVPHVGGPIDGPCSPNVLIGGLPAARVGDLAICVGPPDIIAMGSTTVLIGGQPCARIGDVTAHGGVIVVGMPTVLVGG